jgi:hypothetical protein
LEQKRKERKLYFRVLKKIMKIRYKEPRFVYLGDKITNSALIISNHEGTDAPMSLEIYLDTPVRMWGASEMNSGLVSMYKYQSRVYFHEKKHWNLHLARLFCLIASPLTNLFYSGLDLISTYRDARLVKTIRESLSAIENGENVVVFPEISEEGYLAELEGFHEGVVMLAEICHKRGIDLPIFVTYFRKSDLTYIVDKPVTYSELACGDKTRAEIAKDLCDRCNTLGKIDVGEFDKSESLAC